MIAVTSGAANIALTWIFLFRNPYRPVPLDHPGLLPVLGIVGVLVILFGSLGWGTILMVLGVVTFLPLGLYLMLTPGIFFWMGPATLGHLVAGMLLRPRKEPTAATLEGPEG